jgi:hypothetical protein
VTGQRHLAGLNTRELQEGSGVSFTWLEEQLTGQRHLAGLINTLENFR